MSVLAENTYIAMIVNCNSKKNRSHHFSQNSNYITDHSLSINTNLFVNFGH